MLWMLLVLVYGLLKGTREIIKKKSLEKSTVMEVLFFYTLYGFLLVSPDVKNAMGVPPKFMFYIALKSFIIFLAWICSFKAIKKMPISFYGILDLSRVLFATMFATIILGEILSVTQMIGLFLVACGLLLLKFRKNVGGDEEQIKTKYIIYAFFSCFLNAFSGLMDKILMKDLNSSQLQFWYMLFLVLMYFVYILVTRTKVNVKASLKNYWIWILAILFVIADKALFIANGMPESRISVMTLIKQSACLVTILAGKFIYKEKNIKFKLLCAGIVVAGIVVAVL